MQPLFKNTNKQPTVIFIFILLFCLGGRGVGEFREQKCVLTGEESPNWFQWNREQESRSPRQPPSHGVKTYTAARLHWSPWCPWPPRFPGTSHHPGQRGWAHSHWRGTCSCWSPPKASHLEGGGDGVWWGRHTTTLNSRLESGRGSGPSQFLSPSFCIIS